MYPTYESPAKAKKAFKRCRTVKWFILKDDWIKKHDPVCGCCGKKFSEHNACSAYDGNRCKYIPRMGRVVIAHYLCCWEKLLERVFDCKTY